LVGTTQPQAGGVADQQGIEPRQTRARRQGELNLVTSQNLNGYGFALRIFHLDLNSVRADL
jgi:hypothetical protein